MRIIFLFILYIFYTTKSYANNNDLIIYTYDSFVSEWGPGPIIEKIFEEKFDQGIKFVAVDSAATLLPKLF